MTESKKVGLIKENVPSEWRKPMQSPISDKDDDNFLNQDNSRKQKTS
jgi:hypothetical protein